MPELLFKKNNNNQKTDIMKKSILFFTAILFSITSVNAQWWSNDRVKGNGDMVTKNRSVSSYDKVSLVGSMDVDLVRGNEGELKIEAESNLQQYITTGVKNGVLKISVEKGVSISPSGNKGIKVTVPFEDLEGVALTGSGDIQSLDQIKSPDFETQVTGSGNLKLNLNVRDLSSSITGSGDTELRGNAETFSCKVTGSGDFNAFDLKAGKVDASVSGSGDIEVTAMEELKARVSGSGDIIYQGNPQKQDFKTAGSGSVTSR